MPRKKPFSAKQKKKQLQERRRRKQGCGPSHGLDSAESSDEKSDHEFEQDTGNTNVAKINEQPAGNQLKGKYDPNRYHLHFFQETKEEIAQRKKEARQPYQQLSEESLEMRVDMSDEAVIDFPKRPHWDYNQSKQQLEANEERHFKSYRENLLSKHDHRDLSYVELNLETWRQLWRVMEMSDMFLLITDIRHPLLHFPPALYKYIEEDLHKQAVLVLNKVDLAPPSLVVAWQQYFKENFPRLKTVCFTSFPKSKSELSQVTGNLGKVIFKKRKRGTYRAMGPKELLQICKSIVQDQVNLSSWERKIEDDQNEGYHGNSVDNSDDDDEEEMAELTSKVDLDCCFHKHELYKDGLLTIGCIGFPNVGKSSVMNGLMGKKVVSVSRTPGHTKHFQTIFLTPTVRLCDSPGLVFPSRVVRPLQVLGGIYPVAQLQEPYSNVCYLAERMDLPRLLRIKPLDDDVPEEKVQWTAMDICDAWAEKRGFLTAKAARPDTHRAANHLLRMAVEGRICLCHPPPGYITSRETFESHPDTVNFIELQNQYSLRDKASADKESESEGSEAEDDSSTAETIKEESEKQSQAGIRTINPFALLADSD